MTLSRLLDTMPTPDISEVVDDVERLLNDSIATEGYRIGETPKPEPLVDLSKIDFGAPRDKFTKDEPRIETEKLKGQIDQKLKQMVRQNPSRVDFLDKFQKLIEDYNAGSYNPETFFNELLRFTEELNGEEKRSLRESLTEEELAIFDILTRPEPELSDKERDAVKKIAKDLLAKLKSEKLILDWREKMQTRAGVLQAIRLTLRTLPPIYTPELKRTKTTRTYAHIYDSYFGAGSSLYQPLESGQLL